MSTETKAIVDNLLDYITGTIPFVAELRALGESFYAAEAHDTLQTFSNALVPYATRSPEVIYRAAVQHLTERLLDLASKTNSDLMKIEHDDPEVLAAFHALSALMEPEEVESRGAEIRKARLATFKEIADVLFPAPNFMNAAARARVGN